MSLSTAPLAIQTRYTRSIHLERDYANTHVGVRDYQATPLVLQTTERIMQGLAADSTARAFSLIGPYGSGKSAFGVFLARYLSSSPNSRRRLVAAHSTNGVPDRPLYDAPLLLPLLVSGNNESLRRAVLHALVAMFEAMPPLRDGRLKLPRVIAEEADNPDIDPQRVADLLAEACALVADRTAFSGIIFIIDELGQFLDYAARRGDDRDLFVLQTLAEMAARSGQFPCIFLTILHQSFERYAGTAGAARRTEWGKVQGRFVDLPFQESPVQMLRIVGHALGSATNDPYAKARQLWAEQVAPLSERLGLCPPDIGSDEWRTLLAQVYPLHPTVLVALPLLFRQLAQNERSLFAFLTSREPWSMQDFLLSTPHPADQLPIYRLPHLYAYIHATLGASLFGRARGQRWAELAEARAQMPEAEAGLADVLTTIGTLGALGQTRGLQANAAQLAFALTDQLDHETVESALQALQARKHVTFRQHRESFVIWEGSDLDIDGMTQIARRELSDRLSLVKLLQQYTDSLPIVARRHSYQTGAVRYFAVRYIDAAELRADVEITKEADGEILYVVPSDDEVLGSAQAWAELGERAAETQRIVVLPTRVRDLRDLLLDVAALQRVLDSQPELEGDRAARREIASRLIEARQALAETITDTYGPGSNQWFWRSQAIDVRSTRQIDELLSSACDLTYSATPRIWNELIVRRQPSSAANKARRNLIEVMLNNADKELLGLSGYPPERAIYESVLRATGIHRQDADGFWHFGPPDKRDLLQVQPVWDAIQQFIDSTEGQALPIVELHEKLEAPPFGIKAGLLPLLLMAAYLANVGEIAWYEHGNYVAMPDIAMFERMIRQPAYFSMRRSRARGGRAAIYERLARTMAPRSVGKPAQVAILDGVTPLLRLLNKLPPFSRTTRRVSPRAQAIRQALLNARAPDELLFEKLPLACDLLPFAPGDELDDSQVETFFVALRDGLQELQDAYSVLVDDVCESIRTAFGAISIQQENLRSELSQRYTSIADAVSDAQIRALGMRLEQSEGGNAWIESVGALVGRKPLEAWNDGELKQFELLINDLGRRFRAVEQIAVVSQVVTADSLLVRVGIANGSGEYSAVIHTASREPLMQQLYDDLKKTLARYGTLTLEQQTAVLTELLQPLLEHSENGNGHT